MRGGFNDFKGTIVTPAGGNAPEKVSAEISVGSIRHPERRPRQPPSRAPIFSTPSSIPSITFESTAVHQHDDEIEVEGNLTIRGVTKKVLLEVEFRRPRERSVGRRPHRVQRGHEDRPQRIRLVWNQALEAGGVAVGDDIKIELQIEAVKQA